MIIKDNMANMCAKVTSTYMEFTLAFGPKPEFSFSFKYNLCFRLTLLYHGIRYRTSVLFYFCAIHLPPAEEGEFLLYYIKPVFPAPEAFSDKFFPKMHYAATPKIHSSSDRSVYITDLPQ